MIETLQEKVVALGKILSDETNKLEPEIEDEGRVFVYLMQDKSIPEWKKAIPLITVAAVVGSFRIQGVVPNKDKGGYVDNTALAIAVTVAGIKSFQAVIGQEKINTTRDRVRNERTEREARQAKN